MRALSATCMQERTGGEGGSECGCIGVEMRRGGVVQPLVLERPVGGKARRAWAHTKSLYRLSLDSQKLIRGCSDEMRYPTISSLSSMDEEHEYDLDHYW